MVRLLSDADRAAFEVFLSRHADTSMFLRANARKAGLVDRGEPFQSTHLGRFEGDALAGVVAHAWNGMVVLQAPSGAADLARQVVTVTGRPVRGLIGVPDQVGAARTALGLDDAPTTVDGGEWMFALDLVDLVVPAALTSGDVSCRAPAPEERDTLCAWRLAYDIELLGSKDTPETRARSTAFLDAQIAAGHAWVAVHDDRLVSLAAFNAALPDIVQLGGIYTPPPDRGRGYARVAVAASLLAARAAGVSRAVLFTNNPSAAKSYEAVGFRRIGDYSLVLFA